MKVVTDGLERLAGGVELCSVPDVGIGELAAVRRSNNPGPRKVFAHRAAMHAVGMNEVTDTHSGLVVGQELSNLALVQAVLGLLDRWAERWSSSSCPELGMEVEETFQLRREVGQLQTERKERLASLLTGG